ncbi:hypothetical protein PAHAL_4G061000 [Panicum hallii]|uniref:Uncharacterized protein n=1 Tax=Panicum hallii TaxID=206008 RepID=A0A2T8JBZ6_9POAL|nr:hypothetical protein PAHAL_4G061000 [Panicum hallii]
MIERYISSTCVVLLPEGKQCSNVIKPVNSMSHINSSGVQFAYSYELPVLM